MILDYVVVETPQEIFDLAVTKLAEQPHKAMAWSPVAHRVTPCYVAPDGCRCVLGHVLQPSWIENLGNTSILGFDSGSAKMRGEHPELYSFLQDLQNAHDGAKTRDRLKENLQIIAKRHGLQLDKLEAAMNEAWLQLPKWEI